MTVTIYKKFILRQDEHAPEYSLYNIGEYTFSSYKVIWKALAKGVEAVTISNKDGSMLPFSGAILIMLLNYTTLAYEDNYTDEDGTICLDRV